MSIATWILGVTGVSTTTGVGLMVLRKIGGAIQFLKQHKQQLEATHQVALDVKDHLMKNLPAVEIGQILEQAATLEPVPDATDLRRAKIAVVLNLLPQAAGVEFEKLKEPAVAPVIAKMLNDHLPELGGSITPSEVTGLLNAGEASVKALHDHELLQTVLQVLACVAPATSDIANHGVVTGGTETAATQEAPALQRAGE